MNSDIESKNSQKWLFFGASRERLTFKFECAIINIEV